MNPIHGEIFPIRRENAARAQRFGKNDQRRIGEIHRQVGVSLDELTTPPQALEGRGDEHGTPREKEVETGTAAPGNASEKVRRFRENGFRAHHVTRPAIEECGKLRVPRLRSIEQRHECARVQEKLIRHASATRGCRRDDSRPGPEPLSRVTQ